MTLSSALSLWQSEILRSALMWATVVSSRLRAWRGRKLKKKEKENKPYCLFSFVPGTGLEPALLSKYAPETYASTNSAIRAFLQP